MKAIFFYISFFILFFVFIFFKKNKIHKSNTKYLYHDNNFNKIDYNKMFYDHENKIYSYGYMSPTKCPKII